MEAYLGTERPSGDSRLSNRAYYFYRSHDNIKFAEAEYAQDFDRDEFEDPTPRFGLQLLS